MPKNRLWLAASLFLGLAGGLSLTACDRSETLPAGASSAPALGAERRGLSPLEREAFEKEAVAIKARFPDEAEFETAMKELAARYRLAVPEAPAAPPLPAALPEPPRDAESFAPALAKGAAQTYVWKPVKVHDITYPYALFRQIQVPVNQTLTVYTEQISEFVDPYLIAFYRTTEDPNSPGFQVKVVGMDDDGRGGRNAQIVWKNTTSSSKLVEVVAIAYRSSTTGEARIRYSVGGSSGRATGRLRATRLQSNLPVDVSNCTAPYYSLIVLDRQEGGFYGTSLLGVNATTRRGGNIFDFETSVILQDLIPEDGESFLLPYLPDNTGNTYGTNHYWGVQYDLYLCDQ